ncbi:hypothetical protein D3C86_1571200 [compost metagenome]
MKHFPLQKGEYIIMSINIYASLSHRITINQRVDPLNIYHLGSYVEFTQAVSCPELSSATIYFPSGVITVPSRSVISVISSPSRATQLVESNSSTKFLMLEHSLIANSIKLGAEIDTSS